MAKKKKKKNTNKVVKEVIENTNDLVEESSPFQQELESFADEINAIPEISQTSEFVNVEPEPTLTAEIDASPLEQFDSELAQENEPVKEEVQEPVIEVTPKPKRKRKKKTAPIDEPEIITDTTFPIKEEKPVEKPIEMDLSGEENASSFELVNPPTEEEVSEEESPSTEEVVEEKKENALAAWWKNRTKKEPQLDEEGNPIPEEPKENFFVSLKNRFQATKKEETPSDEVVEEVTETVEEEVNPEDLVPTEIEIPEDDTVTEPKPNKLKNWFAEAKDLFKPVTPEEEATLPPLPEETKTEDAVVPALAGSALFASLASKFKKKDKPQEETATTDVVTEEIPSEEPVTQEVPTEETPKTEEPVSQAVQEEPKLSLKDRLAHFMAKNKPETATSVEEPTVVEETPVEPSTTEPVSEPLIEETPATTEVVEEVKNEPKEKKPLFGFLKKKEKASTEVTPSTDNEEEEWTPRFMRKKRHLFLRFILGSLFYLVLFVGVIIGSYFVILQMSHKPISEEMETLGITKIRTWYMIPNSPYTIASYDIAGGANNPSGKFNKETLAVDNVTGGMQFLLDSSEEINFAVLQGVDESSTRSAKVDETYLIGQTMIGYSRIYCENYKTMFKFWPIPNFDGMMHSGLYTLSEYHVNDAYRYPLPHSEGFPDKFFAKDACISLAYVPVARSERNLWIINVDFSDYSAGSAWNRQFEYIHELMQENLDNGDYIIIGGNFQADFVDSEAGLSKSSGNEPVIDAQNMWEGYHVVVPSNATELYTKINENTKNANKGWVQDGFIVSDNITATSIILDSEFQFSNHNPVLMTFTLNR